MKKETTMHVGRCTRMGLIEEEGVLDRGLQKFVLAPLPLFPIFS